MEKNPCEGKKRATYILPLLKTSFEIFKLSYSSIGVSKVFVQDNRKQFDKSSLYTIGQVVSMNMTITCKLILHMLFVITSWSKDCLTP